MVGLGDPDTGVSCLVLTWVPPGALEQPSLGSRGRPRAESRLCDRREPAATWILLLCCASQLVKYHPGKQPPRGSRSSQGQHCSDPWNPAMVWALLLPLLGALGNEGTSSLFAQSERANAGSSLEGASRGPPPTPCTGKKPRRPFPLLPRLFKSPWLFSFFSLKARQQIEVWIIDWEKLQWLTVLVRTSLSGSLGRCKGRWSEWQAGPSVSCPGGAARGRLEPVTAWLGLGPQIEACALGGRCRIAVSSSLC